MSDSDYLQGFDMLLPTQAGDRLLIRIVQCLRTDGSEVVITEAGGIGPDTAVAVVEVDGIRMRLTAAPD